MNRTLLLVLAATCLAVGGVAVGSRFQSTERAAARAKAPAEEPVAVPVERRIVVDSLTIRGEVRPSSQLIVDASQLEGAQNPVVTRQLRKAGTTLSEGDVLAEISGRPLLALGGSFPAYRDLVPNAAGPDVTQYQESLIRLGLLAKARPSFDDNVQVATRRLLERTGYAPTTTGPETAQPLRLADERLRAARAALQSVRRDPVATPEVRRAAEEELATAEADRTARDEADGVILRRAEVIFFSALPAVVAESIPVGAVKDKPIATLTGGPLEVTASTTADQRGRLRSGQSVEIRSEVLGITARGEVRDVAPAQGPDDRYPVSITFPGPLEPALSGESVRVTILRSTTASAVLAVPSAALRSHPDAPESVDVLRPDGSRQRSLMDPGLLGDGWVEVVSATPPLTEGDRVVVG